MKGVIVNFRSARHHQTDHHMVIEAEGVKTIEEASKLVGKNVVYTTESGKAITGEVKDSHGNSGAVRVTFEKGMPGQSLGKPVEIQ
ncbi:MAG: 50S ribosomal protein L35ae [archaeon]